jgi:NodT family efflux transporter outer membrane factor (OMF) lipoprotein
MIPKVSLTLIRYVLSLNAPYGAGLLLFCFCLSSCKVGPTFHPPLPPATQHYLPTPLTQRTIQTPGHAGEAQCFLSGYGLPTPWWRSFGSPKLNRLVCRGLAHSPNLIAAKAALRQANEQWKAGVGNLFPTFTAQFSAERGSSSSFLGFNIPSAESDNSTMIFNAFNTSVDIKYVFDVFGGVRREIENLRAQVDYQYFQWKAAQLNLISNVINNTILLASTQTQINVTRQLIKEQEQQWSIMKKQFTLGGVSGADLFAQENQVAQTRATLPPLEKQKALLQHTLSILTGDFPSTPSLPFITLNELTLPKKLPLRLPSQLVRHRPDVRAAEALWKAANAQVGVATAQLYPQFTLTGMNGHSSPVINQFLSSQYTLWNLGGSLLQPIFKGGRLRAQRRAAIAAYHQAAAEYRIVVLQAFKNVADSLRAIEMDARTLHAQKQAEHAARQYLRIAQQQFQLGGINYLTLLDAQRQYQQARIQLVQAQTQRYADTTALFQALGGGGCIG